MNQYRVPGTGRDFYGVDRGAGTHLYPPGYLSLIVKQKGFETAPEDEVDLSLVRVLMAPWAPSAEDKEEVLRYMQALKEK